MQASFVSIGADLRAYFAIPGGTGPFPGVLLFQEAFGVNDYIQSEVRRLAENGYAAIAPDYFGGETFTYAELDKVRPKLASLTRESTLAGVDAALAYLDAQPNVLKAPYGAVGFCWGGRAAVICGLFRPDRFAAAVSFYGGGIAPAEPRYYPPLLGDLGLLEGELLLIYGADDEGIAPAEHGRIVEALSDAKKNFGLRVFAGAGHGFASRDRESYRPAQAETAWGDTLNLFDRVLRRSA